MFGQEAVSELCRIVLISKPQRVRDIYARYIIRVAIDMTIRVKLHGRLRLVAGSAELEIPDTVRKVGDLLEELSRTLTPEVRRYIFDPGTRELSPSLVMLVNGHSIRMLNGLNTQLTEKDDVTIDSVDIMEIVGGG